MGTEAAQPIHGLVFNLKNFCSQAAKDKPLPAQVLILIAVLGQVSPQPPDLLATQTATKASIADPLDSAPLSAAELALLEALDTPPEIAPPRAAKKSTDPWSRAADLTGRRTYRQRIIAETGARTVLQASSLLPSLRSRWMAGPRSPVFLNGLRLESVRTRNLWLRADPFLVGQMSFVRGSDRRVTSEEFGGFLELQTRRAQLNAGAEAQTSLIMRSADRGVGAQADLGWGGPKTALRIFGSFQQQEDLRTGRSENPITLEEEGSRFGLGIDGRAEPTPWLKLNAQLALRNETGLPETLGHDHQDGLLLSSEVTVGTASTALQIRGGWSRARFDDAPQPQQSRQVQLLGHWSPLHGVRFEAGGQGLQFNEGASPEQESREWAAHGFMKMTRGRWFSQAGLRYVYRTENERAVRGLLPQLDIMVLAFGDPQGRSSQVGDGLGLRFRSAKGLDRDGLKSWRWSTGPTLRMPGLWIDLRGVLVRIDRASLGTEAVLGAEVEGAARVLNGLHLSFAAAWLDYLNNPALRGHLALRYSVRPRRGYVELRARASSGRWPTEEQVPANADPALGFFRVGLAGGVDLSPRLRIEASAENALDVQTRDLGFDTLGPGLDFRVRLKWST